MKLYSVTDGYIDYLRSEHAHVYSNKENARVNTRKYIGVVVEIGTYKYYVPLSSPKEKDYFVEDGTKRIRRDSFLIFRIISQKRGKRSSGERYVLQT
ncbi:MAG: type III toxin-antitoxin system ToxN/AbiQ family toxin [Lachnospiraceae bacterium]|nr:type III toxin-antitoxin system ToxN/AbiQ family toxin [Lachnospiraceae bacterium]